MDCFVESEAKVFCQILTLQQFVDNLSNYSEHILERVELG